MTDSAMQLNGGLQFVSEEHDAKRRKVNGHVSLQDLGAVEKLRARSLSDCSTALDSGHGSDISSTAQTGSGEVTAAHSNVLSSALSFGKGIFGPNGDIFTEDAGGKRLGYSVPSHLLESTELELRSIPSDATLLEHGVKLLNVQEQLRVAGITEENIDSTNREHRKAIGRVLVEAAERTFGPQIKVIHLADTSRVSGAAEYCEATVRCTDPNSSLRAGQHVFHIDKFLPGIAKLYGGGGLTEAAKIIVDSYWPLWEADFTSRGVTKDDAIRSIAQQAPGMLNFWISLTPGEIKQDPLAIADLSSVPLDDDDLDHVSTHKIAFPNLEDTITVLRKSALQRAKIMFKPRMRFGEVLVFSTTSTPHSAVSLNGCPNIPRSSAEMRFLIVNTHNANGMAVDRPIPSRVHARAHFMKNSAPFGRFDDSTLAAKTGAGGRQGFAVRDEFMEEVSLNLEPITSRETFEANGVEILSVRDALEAAGITEDNFDPTLKEHRCIVGKVLLLAAKKRFPGKTAVHMADTSRVSGAAVYGEATVRDTDPASVLRTAHHAAHIDKFLPGVAKFWGKEGDVEGARCFVNAYWPHWMADFAANGYSEEAVVSCVTNAKPGLVNLWVSLTKGEIQQQPLAVLDKSTIPLTGDSGIAAVSTCPVFFKDLKDTLTILRSKPAQDGRWLWQPRMRFGEVLLFSTTQTPHTAVWLPDAPHDAARRSAEMRVFLVD